MTHCLVSDCLQDGPCAFWHTAVHAGSDTAPCHSHHVSLALAGVRREHAFAVGFLIALYVSSCQFLPAPASSMTVVVVVTLPATLPTLCVRHCYGMWHVAVNNPNRLDSTAHLPAPQPLKEKIDPAINGKEAAMIAAPKRTA